ncbi:MAG TPA: WbqC family protein, partial [Bacillales bacterium]|nr:WbqC family protein [Bacillales bacterium]
MKTGIMQTYLFPYIGYFQLIHSVDQFVIYDDVQYIKSGWINRNRILVNQKDFMFTLSLKKASSSLNINERYFSKNFGRERDRLLKTLKESYGQMDDYENVSTLLENALGSV